MEFLQLFLKHFASIFLCITSLFIPCKCALQEGRWYFVFAGLDFSTEICLVLAIIRYNRPVTLSILSPDQQCQHLLGTCKNGKFLGPTPGILNQNILSWRLAISVLPTSLIMLMHTQVWPPHSRYLFKWIWKLYIYGDAFLGGLVQDGANLVCSAWILFGKEKPKI